jgi:adenylate kinase
VSRLWSFSFSSIFLIVLSVCFFVQLAEIVNHGKLVSDEIIINLLSRRLEEGEEKGELGFILDGFPRTIRQAVS